MIRTLSRETWGKTLALQMRAAEPKRDRRHEALHWSAVFVGVFAALCGAAVIIHKIAEALL